MCPPSVYLTSTHIQRGRKKGVGKGEDGGDEIGEWRRECEGRVGYSSLVPRLHQRREGLVTFG